MIKYKQWILHNLSFLAFPNAFHMIICPGGISNCVVDKVSHTSISRNNTFIIKIFRGCKKITIRNN